MTSAADLDGAFARGVRLHREQRGESQQWLADNMRAAGHEWHQSTVYKVESGKRKVVIEEAASIAAIFGVPIAQLLASSDRVVAMNRVLSAGSDLANTYYEMDQLALKSHQQRRALAVACADYDDIEDSWEITFEESSPVPAGSHHKPLIAFDGADSYALALRERWSQVGALMDEYASVGQLDDFPPSPEASRNG